MTRVPLPRPFLDRPIAHRGLHGEGRAENGMAAFEAAIAGGYGIELDVQPSAEGEAIVFHDEALERLTGQPGHLADLGRDALRDLRLRDGTPVPTLSEVLNMVAGRAPILIEIKDHPGLETGASSPLPAAVARALKHYGGPVAVMSFSPAPIHAMRDLAPHIPRGLTTDAFDEREWAPVPAATLTRLRDLSDYEPAECSFVSHDHRDLDRRRLLDLKAKGATILTWTIRSADAERAARRVADNVTFEGYRP